MRSVFLSSHTSPSAICRHLRLKKGGSTSALSETRGQVCVVRRSSPHSVKFVYNFYHTFNLFSFSAKLAKITASIIGGASDGDDGCITVRELEDQLMGVRIKEADNLAELKEMRQKVMELETQNHVCTNQLRRQDDEMKRVREEIEAVQKMRRELEMSLRQERQRCVQRESELNEQCIMERLKYSEAMQSVQELRQTITQLELKVMYSSFLFSNAIIFILLILQIHETFRIKQMVY
uniref:HOOK domain-containing protein n=1 Tax=Angiostrongylus cantonensis TaxID=6313 RepID=A0A0K0D8D2_ANGCA